METVLYVFLCLLAIYGLAHLLVTILGDFLFPRHLRVWAVVPLRGRVDTPEAVFHSASVSRLYEQGFDRIYFVDAGLDTESKERCKRLTGEGRFPEILSVSELSERLQFLSE